VSAVDFVYEEVCVSVLQGLGVPPGPRDGGLKASLEATGRRSRGGYRAKLVSERRRRSKAENPEEATERRLAQGCLHMAAADWHVLDVVM
jgi:hypothetical protein